MKVQFFTKNDFKNYIKNCETYYNYYPTSAGKLLILSTKDGIYSATFSDEFPKGHHPAYVETTAGYSPGIFSNNKSFVISAENKNATIDFSKLILVGTEFQIKVWKKILEIPKGKTESYQTIAKLMGNEKSFRAVANALGQNKIAYFIPCHRIIAKNGKISGYKWGVDKKIKLLESEKNHPLSLK